MPVSRHVRATFPADPASAAAARRFVRHAIANWRAADAAADVALLTSEIVTNALVHAGTDIEVVCHVEGPPPRAVAEGNGTGRRPAVTVEVHDTGPCRLMRGPEPAAPGAVATR